MIRGFKLLVNFPSDNILKYFIGFAQQFSENGLPNQKAYRKDLYVNDTIPINNIVLRRASIFLKIKLLYYCNKQIQIRFCLFVFVYLCTLSNLEYRLFIFQIFLHEMSTKKEQIAEALQTTQSFLAKHSDKYAIFYFSNNVH